MADEERTEQATPRKRQEARKKGQVARSTEINGAAIFLALVLTLPMAMRWGGERFLAAFQQQILQAGVGRLSDAIGLSALMVLAPLMGGGVPDCAGRQTRCRSASTSPRSRCSPT
jgi:flagellar biosynthetic protein FlhB